MTRFICKLSLPLILALLLAAPGAYAERFFNQYMGQSEEALLAAEGPPDETGEGWYEGLGFTYLHKTLQGRDYSVFYSIEDNRVAMISVTDNQPESKPRLEFADWRAANMIGKTIDEVLELAGPPQIYTYFILPHGYPADEILGVQTEYMEYQNAAIGTVACNISFSLYDGRVESVGCLLRQPLAYDEYVAFAQTTEKALAEFFTEPVWLRRQTNDADGPDNARQWRINLCMADEHYTTLVAGRVTENASSSLFMTLLFDIKAQNVQSRREINDFILERFNTYWNDPEWQRGGDFNKRPPLPLTEEKP